MPERCQLGRARFPLDAHDGRVQPVDMSYRGVWGWGLVLTFGCSMEVPAAPEEQAASQVTSPIIYGNQEWGSVFSP